MKGLCHKVVPSAYQKRFNLNPVDASALTSLPLRNSRFVWNMADAVRTQGATVALQSGRGGAVERYWSAVRS